MNSPVMVALTFALLFLASSLYALFLQTRYGLALAMHYTWLTVVVGDTMVLGAAAIVLPLADVGIIGAMFAVAGLPIVTRSIVNDIHDRESGKRELLR